MSAGEEEELESERERGVPQLQKLTRKDEKLGESEQEESVSLGLK